MASEYLDWDVVSLAQSQGLKERVLLVKKGKDQARSSGRFWASEWTEWTERVFYYCLGMNQKDQFQGQIFIMGNSKVPLVLFQSVTFMEESNVEEELLVVLLLCGLCLMKIFD